MPESKLKLELRADGTDNCVRISELEDWIEEVKRHTDSNPDQPIQLLVGTAIAEKGSAL